MKARSEVETIVELAKDDRRVLVRGMQMKSREWMFRIESPELESEVKWQGTLEKALNNVDKNWTEFIPAYVHPVFGEEIWNVISQKKINRNQALLWATLCVPKWVNLVQGLRASSHTVVFTGAGMSTESGIPDFRSKSGWWRKVDPRTVATVEALENQYSLFHQFYCARLHALEAIKPHEGHKILADWEKRGFVHLTVTQNVDGLHQQAGSKNVAELHGSISNVWCQACGKEGTKQQFIEGECKNCNGKLRPNVVLFGEALPQAAWKRSFQHIRKADVVIVIGTSLEVYPANELPFLTNGQTVLINMEKVDSNFDITIQGKTKDTLEGVNDLLQLH
ncbi:SIR2 family NAD-dependent protein deacylase [Halalkalibacter flavus]|uniref:SIR2 family NAD-dependent protein deacylase n=1 Tax=Halalkalibacter flavus TaxID=3090668 RepID=UPI002FCAC77F